MSLEELYALIPATDCCHCQCCCGPIIWFLPEDLLIRDYMKRHKIQRVVWTTEQFSQNNMRCPYLCNDRCSIYTVRPLVCRLQGVIDELPCKSVDGRQCMSKEQLDAIRQRYLALIVQAQGMNVFYGTHRVSIEDQQ